MNASDILKICGGPRWHQLTDSKAVSARYDDLGIYKYKNQTVEEISVGIPNSDY